MKKKELLQAYKEGLIDKSQLKEELFKLETEKKEKIRKPQRLPEALTLEEFKKLYNSTRKKDYQARVAFLLAFGSGLRISEITHLEKENIKKDSIHIRWKENWNPKYGKERIVPLPKGWKNWMVKFLPIKKDKRSLERNFKSAAKKAGLPERYHFHSLRHSFCTRAMERGIPPNQVQLLMGHSNLSTTSIYSKANPLDALESYRKRF
jgi:integrase/recombinase XerD